jgi:hypothetical protein
LQKHQAVGKERLVLINSVLLPPIHINFHKYECM